MPKQASLLGSDVPLDSRPEGHSLWDLASTTPGTARSSLCYFVLSVGNMGGGPVAKTCKSLAKARLRYSQSTTG